ncbi:hypothetical protein KAU11_08925 [Candidatus Babeliales bacterium]|nr:hypothetical protein [Candidatus Babeliales bacterium]
MKIESIKIHNFKAIKSYSGKIGGKNVYLIGGNGKGKTSFIDAVFKGLSPKNMPKVPITDNGKKGLIEVDLGDFIARTKFKKGRPVEFELENKNFETEADKFMKSPRSYMERRIGILDFDINDFLALSDTKQVEYVAKHLAVDFADIDIEIEENMESRKFDKKKLIELRLKSNYYNEEDAAKELVDIVAISKEIEAETVKSAGVTRVQEGIDTRLKRIKEIDAEIEALERERDGGQEENGVDVAGLIKETADGDDWLSDPENALMSDETLAEKIQSRDNSTAINKNIQEAKDAKAVGSEIEEIEKMIAEATENIEEQKELKASRISEVISMDELTYSVADECFLYQGRPFDKSQTNTAAQLIIGMKIASMLLKDLKILRVDASLIDKTEFNKVLAWAEENGIELFVELVDREATQLRIEVKDE